MPRLPVTLFFILLVSPLSAFGESCWVWFPVNTLDLDTGKSLSGLSFRFTEIPESMAVIQVKLSNTPPKKDTTAPKDTPAAKDEDPAAVIERNVAIVDGAAFLHVPQPLMSKVFLRQAGIAEIGIANPYLTATDTAPRAGVRRCSGRRAIPSS